MAGGRSGRCGSRGDSLRSVIGGIAGIVVALWPGVGPAGERGNLGTPPSIEIPMKSASGPKRPITLRDILSVREISEVVLSPDGRKVAYLVEQAFLSCNCTRTALFVVSAAGGRDARKLDEESGISALRWTPDGHRLSFLSARSGTVQLWWMDADGGVPKLVFAHRASTGTTRYPNDAGAETAVGVASYEWSRDGAFVAFTAFKPIDARALRKAELQGFRYDDERMTEFNIEAHQWLEAERTPQLWLYDVRAQRERLIFQGPTGMWALLGTLAWSPNGHRLAVSYGTFGSHGEHNSAVVFDVDTGRFTKIIDGDTQTMAIAWSPNGHAMAIMSAVPLFDARQLLVLRLDGKVSQAYERRLYAAGVPFWIGDRLVFDATADGLRPENAGLYEMKQSGGPVSRITPLADKVARCSRFVGFETACVWQSPNDPPRVAIVDLRTRSIRKLADVNPELGAIELGRVEELHWTNGFGDLTSGYLLRPPGYHAHGERLPLVIIGYGFSGDFVAQSNWFPSYPAQAFARDGFAVLLINRPILEYYPGNNFERGSREFGYSPLSSLKVIVAQLSREGVIDASRIGFMGHSWAGFWVQLAASHTDLLKAAELHNGGSASEPGTYVGPGAPYRWGQDRAMGGGPYPPTLRNYIGFSATLTADHVKVPVLLDTDDLEFAPSMAYYTALVTHHVPVDMFVYPGDGHVFRLPSHRLAWMQRDLDWFEFWLLGKVRTDPGAADQYAVWTRLRTQLAALNTKRNR